MKMIIYVLFEYFRYTVILSCQYIMDDNDKNVHLENTIFSVKSTHGVDINEVSAGRNMVYLITRFKVLSNTN